MNYAEMKLGTWYPMGGMHEIVRGMVALAEEKGVKLILNQNIRHIAVEKGQATRVLTAEATYEGDIVVAGADYHHVDSQLLAEPYQNYNEAYWDRRVMAPSSLLYYVGVCPAFPRNLRRSPVAFPAVVLRIGSLQNRPQRGPRRMRKPISADSGSSGPDR